MHGTLDKTESREWITVDNRGLQIFGIIHRPLNVDKVPVVVVLHGFASSKHGSNRCYVKLAEALAKAGIATLRFDFRGCGDSEGSLDESSLEELISDADAVCQNLSLIEGIDPSRLGLFGASLGGAIAVQTSALTQMTKALALWAPVASGELWFRDFLTHHPELLNANPADTLGMYQGVKLSPLFREQFSQLFAYKMLATIPHVPLLHMHGKNDQIISLAHQEAFKKAANKEARFVVYPEEQHSLGYAKIFPEVIKDTVAFFKESLS